MSCLEQPLRVLGVVAIIVDRHPAPHRCAPARQFNPEIEIVVRTHNEDESQLLRQDGIGMVFLGVEELARGMIQHIVRRFAPSATSEYRQAGDSGRA
ncbi:MAG: hypothetical protein RKO24_02950 [Candidatus Competibacter sp.]|nr:hypothetical protein [Candidatus Competibacter sp.]